VFLTENVIRLEYLTANFSESKHSSGSNNGSSSHSNSAIHNSDLLRSRIVVKRGFSCGNTIIDSETSYESEISGFRNKTGNNRIAIFHRALSDAVILSRASTLFVSLLKENSRVDLRLGVPDSLIRLVGRLCSGSYFLIVELIAVGEWIIVTGLGEFAVTEEVHHLGITNCFFSNIGIYSLRVSLSILDFECFGCCLNR